jgi:SAM-dependent methyltransferase
MWLQYALSTNERGEQLISKLEAEFLGSLSRKRVLDIGSGYGGACIAAAKRGAEAIGLELNYQTIAIARENLQDYKRDHGWVNVRFMAKDALQPDIVGQLGGRFDLVICDNVIEHVDNARRLINNISLVLNNGGITYITAPNGLSFGQVLKEDYYHLFGISLLDRFDAKARFAEIGMPRQYDVGDYFDYYQYHGMLEACGLTPQQLVPLTDRDDLLETLNARAAAIEEKCGDLLSESGPLAKKLHGIVQLWLERFRARCEDVLSVADAHRGHLIRAMSQDYELDLWYFVARKAWG